jgi:hypothetical protein
MLSHIPRHPFARFQEYIWHTNFPDSTFPPWQKTSTQQNVVQSSHTLPPTQSKHVHPKADFATPPETTVPPSYNSVYSTISLPSPFLQIPVPPRQVLYEAMIIPVWWLDVFETHLGLFVLLLRLVPIVLCLRNLGRDVLLRRLHRRLIRRPFGNICRLEGHRLRCRRRISRDWCMQARGFDYIGDKSQMQCMLPYEILQSLMSES